MRTLVASLPAFVALMGASLLHDPSSADACAGLIGSNGAVNLGRTTTLAAYHDGVEHYVTAFEFQGGGGQFGSLIPLPGVPTNVERGGDWTLERLELETRQEQLEQQNVAAGTGAGGGASGVTVLQEVQIDALDLTVLSGGGPDVAIWAEEHGFRLSPDAPEVLDFYAARSPVFLAAVFDSVAAAEHGQVFGDGTPVHITIPTDNPWVPLRILGLGKQAEDFVQADVYLLTDDRPAILPTLGNGLFPAYDQPASELLLNDLRADAGMSWVPQSGWLTKLIVGSPTRDLRYDLAVDTTAARSPSRVAAGLELPAVRALPLTGAGDVDDGESVAVWGLTAAGVLLILAAVVVELHYARGRREGT